MLGLLLCSPCLGVLSCFLNIFSIIRLYDHITHISLQKPRKLEKISSRKIQYHFWNPQKFLSATESALNRFTSYRISPTTQPELIVNVHFQKERLMYPRKQFSKTLFTQSWLILKQYCWEATKQLTPEYRKIWSIGQVYPFVFRTPSGF